MRTYREENQTVRVVDSITCNCCGCDMLSPSGHEYIGTHISITGGYESTHLGDMEHVAVDVCEGCLVKWWAQFKHPPVRGLGPGE